MLPNPSAKYRPFPQIDLPNRQWPARTITAPPRWLSTDLRDGNQSIIDPMVSAKKARFFDLFSPLARWEISDSAEFLTLTSQNGTIYRFERGPTR